MLIALLAALSAALFAGYTYLLRERMGWEGVGLTVLRTVAVGALVLLLINPGSSERDTGGPAVVLLDASLSMGVAGGKWQQALDTARSLAGAGGTILRFGSAEDPFDLDPPTFGSSRIAGALRAAAGLGGSVYAVTDGELDDAGVLSSGMFEGVNLVVLPRDSVQNSALLDVAVPDRVLSDDSVRVSMTVGTWGGFSPENANLDLFVGERRILSRQVGLPPPPGLARREVVLPPGLLPSGRSVLRLSLSSEGDSIHGDDSRSVLIEVTEQPAVVVLLNPPDWEGRFLVSELRDVAGTTVLGFARLSPGRWIDLRSTSPVSEDRVRRTARDAALLVVRGSEIDGVSRGGRQPLWNWPTVPTEPSAEGRREWYLSDEPGMSPLAGRLATVYWDSVPPLLGLSVSDTKDRAWVALSARHARRGAERPAFIGSDSAGRRSLVTLGTGWWRWRMRGGAAREAYRALLSAGTEWLLGGYAESGPGTLEASSVVKFGEPVAFFWSGGDAPDSVPVTITPVSDDSAMTSWLRFDADGSARVALDTGTYRWGASEADGSEGLLVVEAFSDEYHPRAVAGLASGGSTGWRLIERFARDNWWLFVIVVAALALEWAWRQQRGLP